ncbi:MAG: hypothetical protein AAF518_17870 [Spirochaetota bacterium]
MLKIIVSFVLVFSFFSCTKPSSLQYASVNDTGSKIIAYVSNSGKKAMWFQVFDQIEDPQITASYKTTAASHKVDGHLAKKHKNQSLWVLVANRFEVRLLADPKNSLYQNAEKLEQFMLKFDLAGLAKVKQDTKLTSKQLRAYIPKLPMAEKPKK